VKAVTTLTLYSGARKVAEWPIGPNQAWEPLQGALTRWAARASRPAVVLSDGKVAHLVALRGIEGIRVAVPSVTRTE